MARSGRLLSALIAALILLSTWRADAADPVAESLFQEAIALMRESKFAEACPKLEASQAREAKSGTLLVLGSCHEQLGKTATAWAEYTEAATLARTEGREENATKAEEFAAAVADKLSTLTIVVAEPTAALTVTLDGAPVPSGTFGSALPVDPGPHQIAAAADGYSDWSQQIEVGPDGDAQSVSIPALIPLPVPEPAPPIPTQPAPTPAPLPTPPLPQPNPDAADDETPVWVWVVGGTGLAMLAVSVAFRIDQTIAGNALDDNCGPDRAACPASYDFMADRERENRDFGLFIGFGAGGLVAVGAAVIGLF